MGSIVDGMRRCCVVALCVFLLLLLLVLFSASPSVFSFLFVGVFVCFFSFSSSSASRCRSLVISFLLFLSLVSVGPESRKFTIAVACQGAHACEFSPLGDDRAVLPHCLAVAVFVL